MSFNQYQSEFWTGEILDVKVMSIKEYMVSEGKDQYLKDFENADKESIILYVDDEGFARSFIVGSNPKTTRAYRNSNVKKLIDRNGLPSEIKDWVGKVVKLTANSKGYTELYL